MFYLTNFADVRAIVRHAIDVSRDATRHMGVEAPTSAGVGAGAPVCQTCLSSSVVLTPRRRSFSDAKLKRAAQRHQSILLYHDVAPANRLADSGFTGEGAEIYKLDVASFDAHLQALKQTFPHGPSLPDITDTAFKPGLTLTFDDGGHTALSEVAPRLEALGWRGVFFITTGCIGAPGFLSADDIRELHRRGHMIGSHSVTHPARMSALSYSQLLQEWSDSLRTLSDILAVPVRIASVPGGYCSPQVIEAAREAGMSLLMTSEPSRRVQHHGGLAIVGRYCIKRRTCAATAVALAGRSALIQRRQWLRWRLLELLKSGLGNAYPFLREALLNRMHRQ